MGVGVLSVDIRAWLPNATRTVLQVKAVLLFSWHVNTSSHSFCLMGSIISYNQLKERIDLENVQHTHCKVSNWGKCASYVEFLRFSCNSKLSSTTVSHHFLGPRKRRKGQHQNKAHKRSEQTSSSGRHQ